MFEKFFSSFSKGIWLLKKTKYCTKKAPLAKDVSPPSEVE